MYRQRARPTISIDDPQFKPVQVLPSESYTRYPPVLINASEDYQRSVQLHLDMKSTIAPDARVGLLENAVVINRGVLIDERRSIVCESLINMDEDYRFDAEVVPVYDRAVLDFSAVPTIADGDIPHVMLKQTWDGNFGHWLVESYPRVEIIRLYQGLENVRFVVSDNASPAMRKVYVDSLVGSGVKQNSIVSLADEPRFIPHIIYPTPITVQPWIKSPATVRSLEMLADRLRDRDVTSAERLFVSRNRWSNRRLINEDLIIEIAEQMGFKVVHPELYSLSEQVSIFSNARFVAGTLGAALTNIVFAKKGVSLLALAPEGMGDDFFWDLVSLKGGRYTSLHGISKHPDQGMHSDFVVELTEFRKALANIES